jgi:dTDP-4-amino-4,6-dideoxygalactose transaminase
VIEDCAHAIETTWHGLHAGTIGDFGCFSFYVTKNATTGEGGMLLAKSDQALDRAKLLALHGLSRDAYKRFSESGYKHYQVVEQGFKYNMTDLQAALGIHQLRRVESSWNVRRDIWQRYDAAFCDLPVERPAPPEPDTRHALHLYTLQIDEAKAGISRDEFLTRMAAANIGVGVHYVSLPDQPLYARLLGWKPELCPDAARIGRQTVSLPLSPRLTYDDVEDVVLAVRRLWS